MKSDILIIGAIVIVALVLTLILTRRVEGFTLHQRKHLLCPPFLNGRDAHLMPKSVVFVVEGYNYSETPKIFRDGQLVTPFQYAWDYGNMVYYLVVYAPEGLCQSHWILETSEFVEPIVYEGRSERKMTVTLERRRNGFHKWCLTC